MKDEKAKQAEQDKEATLARLRASDANVEEKLFGPAPRPATPPDEDDEPEQEVGEEEEIEEEEAPPPKKRKLRERFEHFRSENKTLKEQLAAAQGSLKAAIDPQNLRNLTTEQGQEWQRQNWGAVFLAPPGERPDEVGDATVSPAQLQANIQRLVSLAGQKAAADAVAATRRMNDIDKGLRKIAREYRDLGYKPKAGAERIRSYLDTHPDHSVEDAFFATHSKLVRKQLEVTRREGASRSLTATAGSTTSRDRPRKGKHPIDIALEKKDKAGFVEEFDRLLASLPME